MIDARAFDEAVASRDGVSIRPRKQRRVSRRLATAGALLSVVAAAWAWFGSGVGASASMPTHDEPAAPVGALDARRELEVARVEVRSGDLAAARRRWFALLAVVDRIDDANERRDVEARALYSIAASYESAEAAR